MPYVWPYGRASTDKQRNTQTMQMQSTGGYYQLHRNIGRWDESYVLKDFLCDKATSGATPWEERDMGNYIITHAQSGDVILVANYDRAFRSLSDLLVTYERLQERGIRMVIMDMDFDTSGPLGKAVMRILAVVKELERDEIGRRTRETIAHIKRERGTWTTPLGWKLVRRKGHKTKVFVPDSYARKLGAWIAHQIDKEGWNFKDVWRDLNMRKINVRALKKYTGRARIVHLYKAFHAGWPKKTIPPDQLRRPCRATTAS